MSRSPSLIDLLISMVVTIDLKELEARVEDLLHNKLSTNAFNVTSEANNASGIISPVQNSTNSENYLSAIAKLCVENMVLKDKLESALQTLEARIDQPSDSATLEHPVEKTTPKPETFENFHLVYCARGRNSYYRDVPRMFQGDLISDHLRGQHGLPKNLVNFLQDNPEIVFGVTKGYSCACVGGPSYHGTVGYKDGKLIENSPPAESKNVKIVLGKRIQNIIKSMIKSHAEKFKGYSAVSLLVWYPEPYRFFFHHNKTLLDIATSSDMSQSDRSCIQMLCNWFETNHRSDWDEARELMSRGKINPKHYTKLFGPDELYVGKTSKDDPDALEIFKSKEYPWTDPNDESMDDYRWGFNGRFRKSLYKFPLRKFPKPSVSNETEFDITSLFLYPLRFAEPGTKEKLIARGHKFWNCRKRSLVCYREYGELPELGQVRDTTAQIEEMCLLKIQFRQRSDSWWTTQCSAGSTRTRPYSMTTQMILGKKQ